MSAAQLELAVEILGPLTSEVVFVGGATIHLWQTEPGAPPARATDDVDVICDVHTRIAYYALAERLRQRDLREASDESIICRWRHPPSGLVIDVMPVAGDVLGFTNRWYRAAIETAVEHTDRTRRLDPGGLACSARCDEAGGVARSWSSRRAPQQRRPRHPRPRQHASAAQPAEIRHWIAEELTKLIAHAYLDYAIHDVVRAYGPVAEQRAAIVRNRLHAIVEHARPAS